MAIPAFVLSSLPPYLTDLAPSLLKFLRFLIPNVLVVADFLLVVVVLLIVCRSSGRRPAQVIILIVNSSSYLSLSWFLFSFNPATPSKMKPELFNLRVAQDSIFIMSAEALGNTGASVSLRFVT